MALMKKLTSLVAASGLVLSLVGTAAAAGYSTDSANAAAQRLVDLKVVDGFPGGDLGLNQNITRAQFVKIVDVAFGQGDNAKYLNGAVSFPDVKANHWASGYIAMAKNLAAEKNFSLGFEDGSFQPDATVTAAQAVAFLMKFAGVQPNTEAWPNNYIDAAVSANFITADEAAQVKALGNTAATRGLVFFLADSVFHDYALADGSTIYTKYVASKAPTLTVDNQAVATTTDDTVKVTGKVAAGSTALESLFVGNTQVTPAADGTFTADVALTLGDNNIAVVAQDEAGNKAGSTLKVTRTAGAASSITAADVTVAAGQTVPVNAVVADAAGNTVANAVVTGTSTLGTFDGTNFTAGTAAGTGTLVLTDGAATKTVNVTVTAGPLAKVVPSASSVQPGAKVTFTATDANGNVINSGVTYSVSDANALVSNTGTFIASASGTYTVTATQGTTTATTTVGVYGTAASIKLSAPTTVIANDASVVTVTATVVDANGNTVANYGATTGNTVTLTGAGVASNDTTNYPLASAKVVNGVATFQIKTSGTPVGQILALTATSDATATVTGTANIQAVAQVPTSVSITTAPTYVDVKQSAPAYTVKATVLDQDGKAMLNGAWEVDYSVAGNGAKFANAATTATSYYSTGVTADATVDASTGVTGDITVTATVAGVGSASAVTHGVVAGAVSAYKVTVDSSTPSSFDISKNVKVDVQAVDANGVPVGVAANTSVKVTTSIDSTNAAAVSLSASSVALDQTTGAGSFTFAVAAGQKYTGAVTLTVADPNGAVTGGTVNVNVLAGVATNVAFTSAGTFNVPASNPNATVTAQVVDANGNAVAQATDLTLTAPSGVKVNGADASTGLHVTTDATGKLSLNVAVPSYVGQSYALSLAPYNANGISQTGSNYTLNVVDTVAASVSVKIVDATTGAQVFSQSADTAVKLVATVKDAFGNPLTNEALTVDSLSNLYSAGTALASSPTFTYANGVYTSTAFNLGKAGSFNVQVDDKAATTQVNGSASVLVTAGALAKAVVAQADSNGKLTVANGAVSGPFTVQLADQFGNAVVAPSTVTLTLTAGLETGAPATAYAYVRSSATGADITTATINAGSATATFYLLTNDNKATLAITGSYGSTPTALTATNFTVTGF